MTKYASFTELMGTDGPKHTDLKLDNGMVVEVKGLTRFEYSLAGKTIQQEGVDINEFECKVIEFGLVVPKLTLDQVKEWRKIESTEIVDEVMNEIMKLSGKRNDADKSDVS